MGDYDKPLSFLFTAIIVGAVIFGIVLGVIGVMLLL